LVCPGKPGIRVKVIKFSKPETKISKNKLRGKTPWIMKGAPVPCPSPPLAETLYCSV
jgi:hypothetical protein